jgi:hypothetical protein
MFRKTVAQSVNLGPCTFLKYLECPLEARNGFSVEPLLVANKPESVQRHPSVIPWHILGLEDPWISRQLIEGRSGPRILRSRLWTTRPDCGVKAVGDGERDTSENGAKTASITNRP